MPDTLTRRPPVMSRRQLETWIRAIAGRRLHPAEITAIMSAVDEHTQRALNIERQRIARADTALGRAARRTILAAGSAKQRAAAAGRRRDPGGRWLPRDPA